MRHTGVKRRGPNRGGRATGAAAARRGSPGLARAGAFDSMESRVSVHEEYGRKLKRKSRSRELSIPETLVSTLDAWLKTRPRAPDVAIFPFTYWTARKAWHRVCTAAEIHGATIHDARHTYAVHAVQDGIPEARLQRLLGHAHPATTRRYTMHAPEQFLAGDAERVARHMGLGDATPRLEPAGDGAHKDQTAEHPRERRA